MATSPAQLPSGPAPAARDPLAALLRRVRATTGWPWAALERVEDVLPTSLAHLVTTRGAPAHVPDATAEPSLRTNPWVDGRIARTRALAAVPVVGRGGEVIAVLLARDEAAHAPDRSREAALADLAELAADVVLAGRRDRALGGLAAAVAAADERVALAEVDLADRHDLLEAVLETVEVGIVVLGSDGRVSVLNPTVRSWAGLPDHLEPAAAARTATTTLYSGEGGTVLSAVRGPLLEALAGGPVTAQEVTWVAADGAVVVGTCRAMALPACGRGGARTGAVASLTDVTAERAARSELERSNTELEAFAGIAAHDLRSPLSVVDGYLEVLEDDALERDDERAAGWAATARRSALRMAGLLEALLTYAQAGAAGAGGSVTRRPVPARGLLEAVVADLTLPDGARIDLPPASVVLPTLHADPVQLHQLLGNLVGNALKFTRPGLPADVSCAARDLGDAWELVVADRGPGVPAEQRSVVFRAFERGAHGPAGTSGVPGAAGTAGTVSGHGLGLATAQRIVERHDGAITLEDTPGGGLTVRVRLPRP